MLHIDSIERELTLPAQPAEVWRRSFATPEALSSWFPEKIEGSFEVGNSFFLVWGEHRCEALLVDYIEGQSLAYQWHPGDALMLDARPRSELTTVRFTLEPCDEGTRVKLVEDGFAAIPEDRRNYALEQNNAGWDEELAKLPKGYAA